MIEMYIPEKYDSATVLLETTCLLGLLGSTFKFHAVTRASYTCAVVGLYYPVHFYCVF